MALGVAGPGAERVAVALPAQPDVGRGGGAGEPGRPGPAVGRDLDVVALDGRLVGRFPADDDALVDRFGRQGGHARLGRGDVIEEPVREGLPHLGAGPLVAQRPDPGAAQAVAVDQVVARLE